MINRRKQNEEPQKQADNVKPFVDVILECKALRLLVFDNEFDKKSDIDEINNNLSYVVFLGMPKEVFTSDFKQWLFSVIIEKFTIFSECVSKSYIFDELKSKYKEKEEYEQKKVVLEKIFSYRFESKSFKPIYNKLKEKYFYRDLLEINLKINDQLKQDFVEERHEAMALAQNIQDSVNKILLTTGTYKVLEEDVVQDVARDIALLKEKRENPEVYKGITTGYKKIDAATGGWQPGELSVVLGRPGMGKSVLLLNFGYNAYIMNYNVIYITIEMPLDQQRQRFTSLSTNVDYNKIKLPHLMSEEEIEFVERKMFELKSKHKNNFWLIDAPRQCNSQFIDSRITAWENVTGKKADLLIVDPMYLMTPSDRKTDDPVGCISWDLKLLGRERKIPVIAASQHNREAHKRHLHGQQADSMDAAFSDKIGQNADNMISITGDKETACLDFPKSRDALISKLFFIKKFNVMKFEYDIRVDEESSTVVEKD